MCAAVWEVPGRPSIGTMGFDENSANLALFKALRYGMAKNLQL
jgi:hypothetical protein